MAEQQQKTMDSVGMPSTGGGIRKPQWWSTHFTGLQLKIIESTANAYAKAWAKTVRDDDERIAELEAELDKLKRQQQVDKLTYEKELQKCVNYCKELERLFKQTEDWREEVAKAASDAHADVQTIQRTIERLNSVIELIVFVTRPLPWLRKFVNKLDDKRNNLDSRLSKHDQENIKDLVGMPMEHPKRRATDSD